MNQYFVVINRCHHRTGETLGKTVCFVEAYSADEAIDKAWKKHGSDSNSVYDVFEITEENNSFTVYNRSYKIEI